MNVFVFFGRRSATLLYILYIVAGSRARTALGGRGGRGGGRAKYQQ